VFRGPGVPLTRLRCRVFEACTVRPIDPVNEWQRLPGKRQNLCAPFGDFTACLARVEASRIARRMLKLRLRSPPVR